MKSQIHKNAFTLVELMVVVVILSVLSTIGFISYEKYLVDARDGKRVAQLDSLRDSLRLATTKGKLPSPDDAVEIRNGGNPFLYQGYIGEGVLKSIGHNIGVKDPRDDVYYTYMLAKNKKDFQIMAFLEKRNEQVLAKGGLKFKEAYAFEDYSQRYPAVSGQKLGILLEQDTNTPIQEIPTYTQSGYMDLQNPSTIIFDAYLSNLELISGKQKDLMGLIPYTTCKKILDQGGSYGNGIYNINPTGSSPIKVYCEMTLDDGGWTLVGRSLSGATTGNFGWFVSTGNVRDDDAIYSLGDVVKNFNFSEILATTYTSGKDIEYAAKVSVDSSYINDTTKYSSAGETSNCELIYPDPVESPWIGPCNNTDGNGLFYWGQPTVSDKFSFSFRRPTGLQYGLQYNVYITHNSTTEDDMFGIMKGKPGMIFVR